jgi:hypothetical protein
MRRRAYGQPDSEMPLQRYFLFAGGALLTLLLTANWLVPVPVSNELTKSDVNLPPIRIHSELKGPAAVVIDTGQSGIGPIAAQRIVVSPEVVPSESALVTAEAQPYAGLASHVATARLAVNSNEQRTSESQRQNAHRVRAASLARRPVPVSVSPVYIGEPDRASLASGYEFRQTFAQFVPLSAKQRGRAETATSRRLAAVKNSRLPFERW